MPHAVVFRVVSLPATVSSSMNMSNSSSDELVAVDLGVEQLGDDVVAGVGLALLAELVHVHEQLAGGGVVVLGRVLGVVDADHAVRPVEQQAGGPPAGRP